MTKFWLCTIRPDGTEVCGNDGNVPTEYANPSRHREIAQAKQNSLRKNFPHCLGDVWAISDYHFRTYPTSWESRKQSWPEYLKRNGNLVYRHKV